MSTQFKAHVDFNPDKDLPSLEGKVLFITGGTSGLGKMSITAMAKHGPQHVYFTGRNQQAAESLVAEMKSMNPKVEMTFVQMDMKSLASVKAATSKVVPGMDRLDLLMCSAGIMAVPPEVSKDGFEVQFAVNHLGNSMITQQLLPVLLRTAQTPGSDVRIVNLTSTGWRGHPSGGIKFDDLRTTMENQILSHWRCYSQSKLANIIYAAELARRYPAITCASVHPGVVSTEIVTTRSSVSQLFIRGANWIQGQTLLEPYQGCYSPVWVAAGATKDELVNGGYYEPIGSLSTKKLSSAGKNEELAKKLYDFTEEVLAGF